MPRRTGRGQRHTAADCRVVIEATTCADVPGTPAEEQCTQLGNGPAFTIKDSGTNYTQRAYTGIN